MKVVEKTILNRTGKKMPTSIRMPEEDIKGVFLLLHGLGGWREQKDLVAVAEKVAGTGYVVVTFDASDGANAPDADFYNHTTTKYFLDFEDILEWIKQQEWYNKNLILAGRCVGGLFPVLYTSKYPKDISKIVLLAPAVSWKSGL